MYKRSTRHGLVHPRTSIVLRTTRNYRLAAVDHAVRPPVAQWSQIPKSWPKVEMSLFWQKCSLLGGFRGRWFQIWYRFWYNQNGGKIALISNFFKRNQELSRFSRALMMNLIFFYGKTKWMIQNVEEIPKILIFKKKKSTI